jgi:MFS family permease
MNLLQRHGNSTRRITYLLASAWTINCLAYSIVFPFIPLYLHQDRGIPMEKVGTIFPLMGMAIIAAPPLWGYMTDRFGRRPMLQFGQYGRAAVFFALALAARNTVTTPTNRHRSRVNLGASPRTKPTARAMIAKLMAHSQASSKNPRRAYWATV